METDKGRRIIKFMRRAKLRRARYYQRLLRLMVLVENWAATSHETSYRWRKRWLHCRQQHSRMFWFARAFSTILLNFRSHIWSQYFLYALSFTIQLGLTLRWLAGQRLNKWREIFSYYLPLQRQVVERSFEMLAQRWMLRVQLSFVPVIISALCKLRNRDKSWIWGRESKDTPAF